MASASSTVSATDASTTGTTGDLSTGAAASTSTGLVQDVGFGDDFGSLVPVGCKGKIDFLFVMSAAGLLDDMQPEIAAALPKFAETIATKFAGFDYHIMVVDADDRWGLSYCTAACPDILTCMGGDDCCVKNGWPQDFLCCTVSEYPCDKLDLISECDETIGAGTVFPAGGFASNKPCKIDGGRRYLTQDQSNLSETFSCIAQVGISGDSNTAEALVSALSPELRAPGGCNEGFLRDDALLMVTLLSTGTGDVDSPGTPLQWYKAVVAAKHGDPTAVIMLLIGNTECPWWDRHCELVKLFPYWHIQSSDAKDLSPGFDIATDLVEEACESPIPR